MQNTHIVTAKVLRLDPIYLEFWNLFFLSADFLIATSSVVFKRTDVSASSLF